MRKMRNLKLLVFFTLFLLAACDPDLTFNTSQPEDTKSLKSIPNRLQGTFLSEQDSSIIDINETDIIESFYYKWKFKYDPMDSLYKLLGDSILDVEKGEMYFAQKEGDSLLVNIFEKDTIFSTLRGNLIKRFRGSYFINIYHEEKGWEVKKIDIINSLLTIAWISDKDEINSLKKMGQSTISEKPYRISLSKKQFKEFVKEQKGFKTFRAYFRIKG